MTEPETICMIPVEDISPSPLNPRSDLGDVSELAARFIASASDAVAPS